VELRSGCESCGVASGGGPVSGVRIELCGGPLCGVLDVIPGDPAGPPLELLVMSPPSLCEFPDGGQVRLRRGVYRLSEGLSTAGADWVYRWAGERP
jgi:hypothetical protein